jgi:hypothetical protein
VAGFSPCGYDTRRISIDRRTLFREKELQMKLASNLGMLLLGIWLILTGALPLLNISFQGVGTLLNVLAVAAGVLILMNK